MCACKSPACARKIVDEMLAMGRRLGDFETDRSAFLATRIANCMVNAGMKTDELRAIKENFEKIYPDAK